MSPFHHVPSTLNQSVPGETDGEVDDGNSKVLTQDTGQVVVFLKV